MPIELFDARMLAPLVRFLRRHGIRAEPFLDRARIPEQLVDTGGWIGKKQAYDFTFDVVRRTGCREAVFSAYLDFDLTHLGPIAGAMAACKTVKEALDVGLRMGAAAYEGNEYFLRADGDTTWMCYREPHVASPGQTFINDMTLTVYSQLIRNLVGADWRPERFRLRQEVNQRHHGIDSFARCEASRHPSETALAFPTDFLSLSLSSTLHEVAACSPWKFGPDGSDPTVERLHRVIGSFSAIGRTPTLEQTAKMIGVSQATLKRRLAEAGTTYRGLLDRLRFDSACEMLAIPQLNVREIAHELGYSGTSNFVRSFRRMTGMTPEVYRRQLFEL